MDDDKNKENYWHLPEDLIMPLHTPASERFIKQGCKPLFPVGPFDGDEKICTRDDSDWSSNEVYEELLEDGTMNDLECVKYSIEHNRRKFPKKKDLDIALDKVNLCLEILESLNPEDEKYKSK